MKTTGMANSKVKSLLKKIHSIVEDEEPISKLEADLVKSYLRELYELTDSLGPSKRVQPTTIEPIQELPNTKEKVVTSDSIPEQTYIPPTPPSVVSEEAPIAAEMESPKTTDWTTDVDKVPNGRENNARADRQQVYQNDAAEIALINEVPEVFNKEAETPKKYALLFESSSTKELSDKLSRLPVSDLRKALSINDRLLFVADLFQGNQIAFSETIDILNTKYSFDEAKSYMIRYLIDRFEWLAEEREERARDFIKLVERRYLDR
jgi:hypothetical protein